MVIMPSIKVAVGRFCRYVKFDLSGKGIHPTLADAQIKAAGIR